MPQQDGRLGGSHREVAEPYLHERSVRPQPGERERRLAARGHGQRGALWQLGEQVVGDCAHGIGREQVCVVDDRHDGTRGGRQRANRGADAVGRGQVVQLGPRERQPHETPLVACRPLGDQGRLSVAGWGHDRYDPGVRGLHEPAYELGATDQARPWPGRPRPRLERERRCSSVGLRPRALADGGGCGGGGHRCWDGRRKPLRTFVSEPVVPSKGASLRVRGGRHHARGSRFARQAPGGTLAGRGGITRLGGCSPRHGD